MVKFGSVRGLVCLLLAASALLVWYWQKLYSTSQATEGATEKLRFEMANNTNSSERLCRFQTELSYCSQLFKGDKSFLRKAKLFKLNKDSLHDPDEFVLNKHNCSWIRTELNFPTKPLTNAESQFPLAYAMLVHSDFNSILLTLASLYWPQNYHCIHVDAKSNKRLFDAFSSVVSCYDNVELVQQRVSVHWAHPSMLEAAMRCLKVLLNSSTNQWRYVQVISESDFPLKTNAEMVRILTILNGSLDSDMGYLDEVPNRFVYGWREKLNTNSIPLGPESYYQNFSIVKTVPPGGVRIFKGQLASTLTRDFVNFMFKDKLAAELYEWFKDTYAPEEHYWATLIYNPQLKAPGYFPGICHDFYKYQNVQKPWVSRYQVWKQFCGGEFVRGSCRFGVDHLPILVKQPQLIAHKLTLTYQPAAILCLNELLCNRTFGVKDALSTDFHLSDYQNLPSVRYQRLGDKDQFVC